MRIARPLLAATAALTGFTAGCGGGDPVTNESGAGLDGVVLSTSPGGDWTQLEPAIGKPPRVTNLFITSPIATDLNAMLGPDLARFRQRMNRQSVLTRERELLYVLGERPEGAERSYLIIDPAQRALEAGIEQRGEWTVHRTAGTRLRRPAAIARMVGER